LVDVAVYEYATKADVCGLGIVQKPLESGPVIVEESITLQVGLVNVVSKRQILKLEFDVQLIWKITALALTTDPFDVKRVKLITSDIHNPPVVGNTTFS
jgi:hypothetical protein